MGDHQRQHIKNLIKEDLKKRKAKSSSSSGEEAKYATDDNETDFATQKMRYCRRFGPNQHV